MYTLIRTLPWRRLLAEQLPTFGSAFIIAEQLYKLGSFTLELIAFLGTWFVFDVLLSRVLGLRRGR